MRTARAEVRIDPGIEQVCKIGRGVIDRAGISGRAVDAARQREISVEILNERIEADPELIGHLLAGVRRDE